jgi:hypothetical protein
MDDGFLEPAPNGRELLPADAEIGNLDVLAEKYHAVATDLRAIAASVAHS